jgi:hypothetical protein
MIKKTTFALALAAIAITSAKASDVYVAGSTAFRKNFELGIQAAGYTLVASQGSSLSDSTKWTAANQNLWSNSGVFVHTSWTGSEAGVQSALSSGLISSTTNAYTNGKIAFIPNTATNTGASATELAYADIAGTDCSSAISRFQKSSKTFLNGAKVTFPTTGYQDVKVGVQAFSFMADQSFTNTGVTSINANAAKVLFQQGHIPLSLISGKASDSNNTVWLTGRDADSGTRITAFNEVGYGALNTTTNHKVIHNDGTVIDKIQIWSTNDYPNGLNGYPVLPGDGGNSSGGTLVSTIAPLASGASLLIDAGTNKAVSVTYTNFTGTNVVTNSAVGVTSTYDGVASATAPGTNFVVTLKAAGTATKKATFNVASYYITNTVLTNPATAVLTAIKNVASKVTSATTVYLPATNFVPSATGSNYFISYASLNDQITTSKTNFLGKLPVLISYNGVGGAAQVATASGVTDGIDDGIKNGSYTLWNYEHLIRGTKVNAAADTFFTALTNKVIGNVSAPNMNQTDLNVTRQDGGYTIYNK